MTNSPHYLNYRMEKNLGEEKLKDSMLIDGLIDAYDDYHMGVTAENVAEKYQITRNDQDKFALNSQKKAIKAISENKFKSYEEKELMCCLSKLDETDRTILAMKGAGHDYDVIQKFIGNISMGNLRIRAKRARAILADCLGRKKK